MITAQEALRATRLNVNERYSGFVKEAEAWFQEELYPKIMKKAGKKSNGDLMSIDIDAGCSTTRRARCQVLSKNGFYFSSLPKNDLRVSWERKSNQDIVNDSGSLALRAYQKSMATLEKQMKTIDSRIKEAIEQRRMSLSYDITQKSKQTASIQATDRLQKLGYTVDRYSHKIDISWMHAY